LIGYCADQGITFTRGRPYAKNDSCHIELCGYPHNSTYADSGIMPSNPKSQYALPVSLGEVVGIIPALR
jgi:hypothetical protein